MVAVSLGPNTYAAAIGDDLVILDIGRDAYFCLPGALPSVAIDEGTGRFSAIDEELATMLLNEGLVEYGPSARVQDRPRLPPPTRDLGREPRRSFSWRGAVDMVTASLDIALHYRGRSFADLVAAAGDRDVGLLKPEPSAELCACVLQYQSWAPFAPVSNKCLLRSFLLLRLLRRAGHGARWVFGVRTWPFAAHCWLQLGDLALDDTVDRLIDFKPILVI